MGVILGSLNYKLETHRKRAFLQYSSDSRIPPADDADPLTKQTRLPAHHRISCYSSHNTLRHAGNTSAANYNVTSVNKINN